MKSPLVFTMAALCTLALPASANIVQDGDFETPTIVDRASGFDTYYAGQSFGGWTVGGQSVDVVGDNPAAWVWWNAASGHQSVDLNGYGPGYIFQDLHTVAGQSYLLTFALAANARNAPPTVKMDFYWQGVVVDTISFNSIHDSLNPGWTYFEYTLTAPTDLARLTFESLVNYDSAGATIDNVVVQAVPDNPGLLANMALLLPLAAYSVRRGRNR